MRNEFTAIIERDEDWFIAYCPELPGANGQGRTKDEARDSLAQAIELILADRRVILGPADEWSEKFRACLGAWTEDISRPKHLK